MQYKKAQYIRLLNNLNTDNLKCSCNIYLCEYTIISKQRHPIAVHVPIRTPYKPQKYVAIILTTIQIKASIIALILVSLNIPATFIIEECGNLKTLNKIVATKRIAKIG